MALKKISVSLTPELNDSIQAAVGTGAYKTSSEVIRDALRQWVKQNQRQNLELERLKAAVDEGLESGESIAIDPDFFARKRQMVQNVKSV